MSLQQPAFAKETLWAPSSSLALQGPLEATQAAHPQAQIIAFFDDIHLVGKPQHVVPAFATLVEEVKRINLTPNPNKSLAYGLDTDISAGAPAELGIAHAQNGIVAAGTPIGSAHFMDACVAQRREAVKVLLDRLVELPSPLTIQDKTLLTKSLQLRLLHLTRTVPWEHASGSFRRHAADVRAAALQILGEPNPAASRLNPEAVRLQLHLPHRLAGFALQPLTPDVCTASYLSCAAQAQLVLQTAPAWLHPFATQPACAKLQALSHRHPAVSPNTDAPTTPEHLQHIAKCPRLVRDAFYTASSQRVHALRPSEDSKSACWSSEGRSACTRCDEAV